MVDDRNSILYPDEYLKIREFTGTSAFDFTNPDRVTVDAQLRASAVNDGLGLIANYTQATNANKPLWSRSDNRENIFQYSEQINNAYWTKNTTTVTANAITAPNGTLTADKLVTVASAGSKDFRGSVSVVSGRPYVVTFYAKAGEYNFASVYAGFSNATQVTTFNLVSCTVVATSPNATASIQDVGNGWCRCNLFVTANAFSGILYTYINSDGTSGGTSFTGDGTSGVFFWRMNVRDAAANELDEETTDYPQYAGVNGRRWLVLNGAQVMSSTSISSDIFAVGEKLIYIPLEASLLNVAQSIFRDNPNWWSVLLQSSGSIMSMTNFDSNYDNATVAITTNTPMIFRGRHSGGSIYGAIDTGAGFGTESTVASGNTGNMTFNLQIGASSASFYGKLGGIFTDNTGTPDTAFEQRLRSYYL